MRHSRVLLFLLMITVFILSFSYSSAQDIDIENMDNAQLTTLLLQIMQKLEQAEEVTETPEPTPTPTPIPTKVPQPELSDDKAELEALLTAVTQKLKQGEETETAPETPAETMVPASDPVDEPENSVWENKKLLIETLPSYMFIQPTVASKPEKSGSGEAEPQHYNGEICGTDEWGFPCHWYLKLDGSYNCECGNG